MWFDFGQNWLNFPEKALSSGRVIQAKADFQKLMNDIPLKDKSFLNIGFGQGLFLLCAAEMGAKVVVFCKNNCQINEKNENMIAHSIFSIHFKAYQSLTL